MPRVIAPTKNKNGGPRARDDKRDAAPLIRDLANRIIDFEVAGAEDPAAAAERIERVFAKLRNGFEVLVGNMGFDAVMQRAAYLARHVDGVPDDDVSPGPISDLTEIASRIGPRRIKAWAIAVLAHVLSLFCTFIGEDLTLRLVRRVWPDVSTSPTGRKGEET